MKVLLNCTAIKAACQKARDLIDEYDAQLKPLAWYDVITSAGMDRARWKSGRITILSRISTLEGIANHKAGALIDVESPHLDDIAPYLTPYEPERI